MKDKDKLNELIDEALHLINENVDSYNPDYKAWHTNVERFLVKKFGENSIEHKAFRNRLFTPQVISLGESKSTLSKYCCRSIETTKKELEIYLKEISDYTNELSNAESVPINKVFIVHGHDGDLKQTLARLVEKLNITAIILSEQANKGRTIIEKFEEHTDVGAAIALFTKDDKCYDKDKKEAYRARQNVVFEAGYFMGKLGRDKIIMIAENGVEIPSDLEGVVYTDKGNWQIEVCRELKSMGFEIDLNKLMS